MTALKIKGRWQLDRVVVKSPKAAPKKLRNLPQKTPRSGSTVLAVRSQRARFPPIPSWTPWKSNATARFHQGHRWFGALVQARTKYEPAINLKTARAINLEIPALVLARADEVID